MSPLQCFYKLNSFLHKYQVTNRGAGQHDYHSLNSERWKHVYIDNTHTEAQIQLGICGSAVRSPHGFWGRAAATYALPCGIRALETHVVMALLGYLRLQKKWNFKCRKLIMNKKDVLSQGELCDAAVNFDMYQIFQ